MADERSAGAVVVHLGQPPRYLLLKYQGGHWGHVKGHIEAGESIEGTIRREAEEETGLTDLRFVDGFEAVMRYRFRRSSGLIDKRVDMRLALTDETDVGVGSPDEHTDIGWFTYDDALERTTFDEAREALETAHDHLAGLEQASLDRFERQP